MRIAEFDDHRRILFLRDPLRRLVGFYWSWVVSNTSDWCYVGGRGEFPLKGATFRELVEAIQRARELGIELQHHLLSQIHDLPVLRADDHIALIERLDEELYDLDRQYGITVFRPRTHSHPVDEQQTTPAMDRRPEWFTRKGFPRAECFFDAALATLARRCYAEDAALHASMVGARPLVFHA